jgi:hypothetical protein
LTFFHVPGRNTNYIPVGTKAFFRISLLQVRQQGHNMNYVPPSKISLNWVAQTLKNGGNSRNIYFLTNLVSKDLKKWRESEKIAQK